MAAKLGLRAYDKNLVDALLSLLTAAETDMTLFFRALARTNPASADAAQTLDGAYYADGPLDARLRQQQQHWLEAYTHTLEAQGVDDEARVGVMNRTNPKYVLRNHLAETAIRKAADEADFSEIDRLMKVLKNPFDEHPDLEHYAGLPPDWAQGIQVSCSS